MRRLTCFLFVLTVVAGYFAFRDTSASETIKLLYAFLALTTSVSGMISFSLKRDDMLTSSTGRRNVSGQRTAIASLSTASTMDS